MPEGDTVWHTARLLHDALAGRALTRSDFRVPRFAVTDLAGGTVTEAVPRGKHLLIRVDNGLTIHTHLKMEGRWRITPASQRLRDSYRIRLILANAEWRAVGYQLGIAEVLPTAQENRITGHLGPDLLGSGWDPAEAARRLSDNPERPIGEALLDQRNLAGIGNVYKSEVLFLRGIRPAPAGRGSTISTRWSAWPTGCWTSIRNGTTGSRPETSAGATRPGSTDGATAPAGAAAPVSAMRNSATGSPTGARHASRTERTTAPGTPSRYYASSEPGARPGQSSILRRAD